MPNYRKEGRYVNVRDCGKCRYYDRMNNLCDYYLTTGLHRNEDDPVSECSVMNRDKDGKRLEDRGFTVVSSISDVPENYYSAMDVALVLGQSRQEMAGRFKTMQIEPDMIYAWGGSVRSYYTVDKVLRVAAHFQDKCQNPGALTERLRTLRRMIKNMEKERGAAV